MKIDVFVHQAIGVPFLKDGEDFNGWDCWGLIRRFYHDCMGTEIMSHRNEPVTESISKELTQWVEIKYSERQDGDVAFFRGKPFHVSVIIKKKMLHVFEGANTVFERFDSPTWISRLIGVYRRASSSY